MTTLRIQALEKENMQLKKELLRLKPKKKIPAVQPKLEKRPIMTSGNSLKQ